MAPTTTLEAGVPEIEGGLTDKVSLAVGGVDDVEDVEALEEPSLPPHAEISTAVATHRRK